MLPLLSEGAPTLALSLGGVYLGAGLLIAGWLRLKQQPLATAVTAVLAWPLLIDLLRDPERPRGASGPLRDRIDKAFEALARALADNGGAEPALLADIRALRRSVEQADARLAAVDRLLAEEDAVDSEALRATRGRLTQARQHAAREIEAVLSEVLQLRIQVGLLALAGEGRPARERLQQLRARVQALDEVQGLGGEAPA